MQEDLFFTYILQGEKSGRFYVGYTSHLNLRIQEHNVGLSMAMKSGAPWKLVYYETYSTKTEALKREIAIKKRKSRAFIEKLIQSRSSV